MATRKTTKSQSSTAQDTIGVRFRIDRELHARIQKLTERFPLPVELNDQARRCLELGVEVEEHGGMEPMLDSRIKQKVEAELARLDVLERKLDAQQKQLDELMAFLKGPPGKETKLSKKASGGGEARVA